MYSPMPQQPTTQQAPQPVPQPMAQPAFAQQPMQQPMQPMQPPMGATPQPMMPPQQSMGYGQPPRQKSSAAGVVGLVLGIIAILAVILLAIFVLKPFGNGGDTDNTNTENTATLEENTEENQVSGNESDEGNTDETENADQNADPQDTVQNTPAENKASSNTDTDNGESDVPQGIEVPETFQMTTDKTPTLADFTWYSGVSAGGIPDGAVKLDEFDEIEGGWKAYMFGPSGMERFFNVDVSGSNASTTLTFKWFYVFDGNSGEGHDDDSVPSDFVGALDHGSIDALGPGRVKFDDFWLDNGREYAVGTFMWPDGEEETVLLARP